MVKHRALEAGVGAHVQAHFFAQNMPEQPGYETVKSGSAQRNAACRARENGGHKLANRHKPACKGNPRPRGNDKDNEVFQRFDADFCGNATVLCPVSGVCCGRLQPSGLSTA